MSKETGSNKLEKPGSSKLEKAQKKIRARIAQNHLKNENSKTLKPMLSGLTSKSTAASDSEGDNEDATAHGPQLPKGPKTGRPHPVRRPVEPGSAAEDDQDDRPPSSASNVAMTSSDGALLQVGVALELSADTPEIAREDVCARLTVDISRGAPQIVGEDAKAGAALELSDVGKGDPDAHSSTTSNESDVQHISREELNWFEKVGHGVTAQVFRGEWKSQPVAIKQLHLNFMRRGAMAKQQVAFCRETTVAAKIRHNNLVCFYGVCCEQVPYLMITEFMAGGTVFDLLHVECMHLRWKQRLRMSSDIASGMDYLHKFNPQIIHRDLKSINLLLSKAVKRSRDVPEVKVSDFGLARMKEDHEEWGNMTAGVGSLHWMAPEVYSGRYNEKADVFSFAMVLFEIISGDVPFQEMRPSEVTQAVCGGVRPQLDSATPSCPDALMELMISCWTQDPERRPSFSQIRMVLNTITFELASSKQSNSSAA